MPEKTVTAAVLVIGNEILSGRTKDANLAWLVVRLNETGIQLREARVVPDIEEEIIAAVNTLRAKFDYLFTTGGIGPTHDDITSGCVAKAFGVKLIRHPEAVALLRSNYANPADLNEARLRMAEVPEGATLVLNPVSKAPGFRIGNVIVMAGVPSIMQAMLDEVAPKLKTGTRMLSQTVRADAREGDIGTQLGEIAKQHPHVTIGSYPFFDDKLGPNTNLVIRSRDAGHLAAARADVEAMLTRVRGALASA